METRFVWLYSLGLLSMAVSVYGFYRVYSAVRRGKHEPGFGNIFQRLTGTFAEILLQRKIMKRRFPGIFHLMIAGGFMLLFVGTFVTFIQTDLSIALLYNFLCLYLSLILDIAGLVLITGVLLALYRRCVIKPKYLETTWEDFAVLALLLLVAVTGFLVEGFRIGSGQASGPVCRSSPDSHRDWLWSPFGYLVSLSFSGLMSQPEMMFSWTVFWYIHMLLSFIFIAYLPYSKLIHIFISPLNIFFRNHNPNIIRPIDIENSQRFGTAVPEDFSWKSLMDSYACTRCGRCQDVCPASNTKKPLSPKHIIDNIRYKLVSGQRDKAEMMEGLSKIHPFFRYENEQRNIPQIVGADAIWSCTTCLACETACPVSVEIIPKIIGMRQHLVLSEADMPKEARLFFTNMERNFNPWQISHTSRSEWAQEPNVLDIRTASQTKEFDYLLWVGCAGSFDERNRRVTRQTAELLKKAGVDFAILGNEEKCCGETARRMGNEYLAQMLIRENIETLKKYSFKKIVTACPHCLNSFIRDYPLFGAEFKIVHHTQLLSELVNSGQIKPKGTNREIVYHDSCYLGRYNNIYEEPRFLLGKTTKFLTEMKRSHSDSFCCGAGGGMMWLEEKGERIGQKRVREALEKDADIIATACPYCLTMLSDSIKALDAEERLKVMDVCEMIE